MPPFSPLIIIVAVTAAVALAVVAGISLNNTTTLNLTSSRVSSTPAAPLPSNQPGTIAASQPPISSGNHSTTPTITATPSLTPNPPDTSSNEAISIVFFDTPSTVASGQTFTVNWRVTGPSGILGDNATIKTSYHVSSSSGGSSSNVNTDNSNSFGSFTIPKTFSGDYTFTGPGAVEVTISAAIDDKTVSTSKTITLTD
ncbi:MAG: hypothetical protein U1C49_01745 [Candidatus Andersenbacteria bacterium]|nr:hypothetical protein [Candidatus Andersenbacteria bacterium]